MLDVLYMGLTILFFAVAAAYVAGCDRLAAIGRASAPRDGGAS